MNPDVLTFFNEAAWALPLYEAVADRIADAFSDVTTIVHKTQITFKCKYGFAFVSLPTRRVKGWPERCIIVTLGLERELRHPRIAVATEPYPNRWTHHIPVTDPAEVDDELMDWITEAHDFSNRKR